MKHALYIMPVRLRLETIVTLLYYLTKNVSIIPNQLLDFVCVGLKVPVS